MKKKEKSSAICQLMGWQQKPSLIEHGYLLGSWEEARGTLYDTENMALAWKVLNWALGPGVPGRLQANHEMAVQLLHWFSDGAIALMPPEKAQAALLDKILELAIETGLIDEEQA